MKFEQKTANDLFRHVIQQPSPRLGLQSGDTLTISRSLPPTPKSMVLLTSGQCKPWLMIFEEAGPEIENGAKLLGAALTLTRDLPHGG